jgi:nifR3 family TIM-barrel protein
VSETSPIHPVAIGRLALAGNLALAPMHEHSHLILRLLARRAGAALASTEMVTPEDLLSGPSAAELAAHPSDPKTLSHKAINILASTPEDRPLAVQLLPRDAASVAEAVAMLAERGRADLVDLNLACPSRRVVASGRGGAMLRNPDAAVRLVAAAAGASPLPVTIKIRLGFTDDEADRRRALDIAREAVRAGAAGITLHARTVGQGYGGRADWPAIARWAKALAPAPVFGSGDLRTPEAVLAMLRETRCAGAGVARGALGSPWIFRQVRELAASGTYEPVTSRERRETILAHFDGLKSQYGPAAAVRIMRRFGGYYARGFRNAAAARAAFQAVRTEAALGETVEKWFGPDHE